jgi:hypothetical protein
MVPYPADFVPDSAAGIFLTRAFPPPHGMQGRNSPFEHLEQYPIDIELFQ